MGGESSCPDDQDAYAEDSSKVDLSVDSFDEKCVVFRLAEESRKWVAEQEGATLCWFLPNCKKDSVSNGTRPCGAKLGGLQWTGEETEGRRKSRKPDATAPLHAALNISA